MDRTWTHTRVRRSVGAHAVEFSKTAAPGREGASFAEGALRPSLRRTVEYSAYLVRAEGPGAWERRVDDEDDTRSGREACRHPSRRCIALACQGALGPDEACASGGPTRAPGALPPHLPGRPRGPAPGSIRRRASSYGAPAAPARPVRAPTAATLSRAQAPELPLADLHHAPVEAPGLDVEVLRGQRLAVELDGALGEHPP